VGIYFVRTCTPGSSELVYLDEKRGTASVVAQLPAYSERPPTRVWFASDEFVVSLDAGGVLYAASFDFRKQEVVGRWVPVLEGVGEGFDMLGLSDDGTLIYPKSNSSETGELVFVDRDGEVVSAAGAAGEFLFPRVSPDGRRVAIEIHNEAGGHIWVYDFVSETLTRLTSEGHNSRPTWSPDGREILFGSTMRSEQSPFYRVPHDGSSPPTPFGDEVIGQGFRETTWSPDGALVVFSYGGDLFTMNMEDGVTQPWLETPAREFSAEFSPDGKWIAYVSDETGTGQVYVRKFPGPGGRWAVSTEGGLTPVWSRDGGTVFYVGPDGWMYGASVTLSDEVIVTERRQLMEMNRYSSGSGSRHYDRTHDGRFLFVDPGSGPFEVGVMVNFFEELRERVGG